MTGSDQRLTVRLLQYWNMIRKDQPFPDIQHLNPQIIQDIWPQCLQVKIDMRAGTRCVYEYIGPFITEMYGRDMTGLDVDIKVKAFPGVVMHKKLGEVIEECRPREDGGHFVNEKGGLIKYRACFLPFGNEKAGLTHIVTGLSCRMF